MHDRTPRHAFRRGHLARVLPTLAAVVAAAVVAVLAVTTVLPTAKATAASTARVMETAPLSMVGASPALADLAARETSRASRSGVSRTAPRVTIERLAPRKVAPAVTIEKITWVVPVSGYRLTSRFGDSSYLWSSGMHTGLDFAAPSGTPIRSVAAGTVIESGYVGSYGYRTRISLPGGGEVWYCHQASVSVSPGQAVAAGQVIGTVGATGNVTGSHLHLEMRPGGEDGEPVDPYAVLAAHGVAP